MGVVSLTGSLNVRVSEDQKLHLFRRVAVDRLVIQVFPEAFTFRSLRAAPVSAFCGVALAGVLFASVLTAGEATSIAHPVTLPLPVAEPAPAAAAGNTSYTLGPDDQVIVRALHVPEIPSEPMRVNGSGNLTLPLVGSVHVAGLTIAQAEELVAKRLSTVVRDPEVSISATDLKSRPVFVLGAVNKPGQYQLQGRQTLAGLLSQCEGVRNDAGYRIFLTRQLSEGPLPLPGVTVDQAAGVSKATLQLNEVSAGSSPASNLTLRANDVVSIPRADMVYVVGDVKKAGGIVLEEREKISVLQAISLAEGTLPSASTKNAKILHSTDAGAPRTERLVDLRAILDGRGEDLELRPNDILFVPTNKAKGVWTRSVETAIQLGTGVIIFRR